ncbi:amino acid adenylation domain-containing protein [Brenneria goodwinii]|uniref:non-ribosomal peptide synthetase n=1 Tax=Brenneria goodwinii TaxID=1109412 RepID=UPI000EF2040D|nr:non-ribosomal peptide synthetase [Brenneria goodwinii]MCG8157175.1 amino acid adenylation domain-containing protein [Brenneria goodwinii]MCG8160085.1 amino acid adenylation domain-containing protein [Brenneria goodwinii]MCG8164608.1 amino acid adenylation domain-containing protein [Brenneria goodwinii]MCG8170686.1 amino acid adenylation domain-containing protein [Brenneria goodwinii]MCG8174214.1 amino acid adenylation domain-containing protein [Brenneria goodwinii]
MYSSLNEIILNKAYKMSDAIAISDEYSNILTYTDLLELSTHWRDIILQQGVSHNDKVGIAVSRNAFLPCLLLAVIRAGCCWVPLDPCYPKRWRDFVIDDADIQLVIHDELIANESQDKRIRYINVNTVSFNRVKYSAYDIPVNKNDICYIIYTSGSTGTPKGVMIKHENTVNFIEWVNETYSKDELSEVLCCTSICFDLSLFEIFGTLSAGGTCYIVKDGLSLLSLPKTCCPTLINTVPSVMREILRHNALPSRTDIVVNLAGEPLSGELVNSLYAYPNVTKVVNLYGPSETTTYSSWDIVRRGEVTPSIGKPIKRTQIHLLNENSQPVPVGENGEIYISGLGVAAGYINHPELTKERFITLKSKEYGIFTAYKTGDIGRWRSDGKLEYLGRTDDQVKIRGFRVELHQIEEVLLQIPHVQEAVVIVAFPGKENVILSAWLMVDDPNVFNPKYYREYLTKQLPDYMIPGNFNFCSIFPKLPNGKVNRKELRQLAEKSAKEVSSNNPKSVIDDTDYIITLLHSVTGVLDIDPDTDIFTLGVNSLSVLQITSAIKQRFGILIPAPTVYHYPTINRLLNYIQKSISKDVHLNVLDDTMPLLTEAQQQMFYLSQLTDNDPANNISFSFVLAPGTTDADCESLCNILWHFSPLMHAMLPMDKSWTNINTRPQINYYKGTFTEQEIRIITDEATHVLLDPCVSSLWRMTAIFSDNSAPVIILTFHHLLIDDVSLQLIFHCIQSHLYGTDMNIPFTRLKTDTKMPQYDNQNRQWWLSTLEKSFDAVVPISSHFDMIDEFDTRSFRVSHTIGISLLDRILAFCQMRNATLYEFFLSCLVPVLSSKSNTNYIKLGTIMSIRGTSSFNYGIGFYGNLVPIILPTSPLSTNIDILDATIASIRDTSQHSAVSPYWLQEQLRKNAKTKNVIPVMFGCIRQFSDWTYPNILQINELNTGHSHSFLSFQVRFGKQSIEIFIDGRMNIYTQNDLNALIDEWIKVIEHSASVN